MVQHAGLVLGIIDGDAGQPLGDMAGTAAGRVAHDGDRVDDAGLGIDGNLEDGPAKVAGKLADQRHVIGDLAPADVEVVSVSEQKGLGKTAVTPCAASQPANWFISPGGSQATLSMGTSATRAPHRRTMSGSSSATPGCSPRASTRSAAGSVAGRYSSG